MHEVLLNTKKAQPIAQIVTAHVTEKRIDSAKEITSSKTTFETNDFV